MPLRRILDTFSNVGALLTAPRQQLDLAARGRWNGLGDTLLLLLLVTLTAYTIDVARVLVIGWDLGLREGLFELSWTAQRRLGTDLLLLLGVVMMVALPLSLMRRLRLESALALGAVCWIPLLLARMTGHGLRVHLRLPPARPLGFPGWYTEAEWLVGLGGMALLAALALLRGMQGEGRGEGQGQGQGRGPSPPAQEPPPKTAEPQPPKEDA